MDINDTVLQAIRNDPFVSKALEATRFLIYARFRDWDKISRTGKLPFTDEDAASGYDILSFILGKEDPPDMGDTTIVSGGIKTRASSIEMLQSAFKPQPK